MIFLLYSVQWLIAVSRMEPTEFVIHNGVFKVIGKIKRSPWDYCAVTKLEIRGIPYASAACTPGKEELQEFLKRFR